LVAIVILRREEADIALFGSLPEPGFSTVSRVRRFERETPRRRVGTRVPRAALPEGRRRGPMRVMSRHRRPNTLRRSRRHGRFRGSAPASLWTRSAREIAPVGHPPRGSAPPSSRLDPWREVSRAPYRGVRNIGRPSNGTSCECRFRSRAYTQRSLAVSGAYLTRP